MEFLKCDVREKNCRHSANKERREGKVPGILYGKNIKNVLFELAYMDLNSAINRNGEHGELDININGSNHKTLIKELQRDPVSHNIIHIDLEELTGDKYFTTDIPVMLMGEGIIKSKGGIIQREKNSVKVQCRGEDIPKTVNVDLSNLNAGDTFRISDIEMSKEISIVDDINTVLVSILKDNITETSENVNVEQK
ncbi:50S ribosomal protein L25 [Clostridium sp. JN-9]|uniref:50S ribosomal protein L25 n=1 Tax=Clostridium sp. JN-9 TaxID=2507159 RepID=UPI000FFDFA28|nr:50S ribosomal protein L25 [Clostridium sp. JN-9]QAT41057.1 50S ribosomal protein L25 [Clostridium sp. JN-9]